MPGCAFSCFPALPAPGGNDPAREDIWPLHGGIVYIGIRKHIYQVPAPDDPRTEIKAGIGRFLHAFKSLDSPWPELVLTVPWTARMAPCACARSCDGMFSTVSRSMAPAGRAVFIEIGHRSQ